MTTQNVIDPLNASRRAEKNHRICWIFSIFNECNNSYFWKNIQLLRTQNEFFIVSDGGSHDGTQEKLIEEGIPFIKLENSTRGQRFNEALMSCQSDIVAFVHPRSLLETQHIQELTQLMCPQAWGAFTHRFDHPHPLLKFTSWWSNIVRGDIRGIFYLDHILWAKRIFVQSFPVAPIFEDTLFSKQMLRYSSPLRLKALTITSAQRFIKNGIWTQALLNQKLKLAFLLGRNFEEIDNQYEQGIELNRKL